jgi:hypothetical protein
MEAPIGPGRRNITPQTGPGARAVLVAVTVTVIVRDGDRRSLALNLSGMGAHLFDILTLRLHLSKTPESPQRLTHVHGATLLRSKSRGGQHLCCALTRSP